MNKKRLFIILSMIMIMIFSLTALSAADSNDQTTNEYDDIQLDNEDSSLNDYKNNVNIENPDYYDDYNDYEDTDDMEDIDDYEDYEDTDDYEDIDDYEDTEYRDVISEDKNKIHYGDVTNDAVRVDYFAYETSISPKTSSSIAVYNKSIVNNSAKNQDNSVTNETNEPDNNPENSISEEETTTAEPEEIENIDIPDVISTNDMVSESDDVESSISENNEVNNYINPVSDNVNNSPVKKSEHKTNNNYYKNTEKTSKTTTSNVHTIITDKNEVFTLDSLTLETLNNIFNQKFINGHLLVYIDGKLVINDTVTDDLSINLLKMLEDYLGNHEIKVVFTDENGKTNEYMKNVDIN